MRRRYWIIACLACLAGAGDPARAGVLEVPFDFLHNQIVLRATINGEGPYNVVLDTGTFSSTIDIRLAKRLRMPLGDARAVSSAAGAGRASGRRTTCRKVRVGDLTVRDLAAVALDLSKVSTELGRPLCGVLGYGFLDSRIIQIDYFHRRVRFYAESPFSPSPKPPDTARRTSFPMRFRANSTLPVLEDCAVNGTKIAVTLDSGSSLGLVLFPAAIRHLGLERLAQEGIPLQAVGYQGKAHLMKGWVRSVVLKTIDLGAIEVAYVEEGYGEEESLRRRGGSLGNAVLQDFVLTLDYRNRVVVLESVTD